MIGTLIAGKVHSMARIRQWGVEDYCPLIKCMDVRLRYGEGMRSSER